MPETAKEIERMEEIEDAKQKQDGQNDRFDRRGKHEGNIKTSLKCM